MCIGAQADSGVGGSVLTWTLQDGVLTISGKGAMDNYNYDNMGQVDIPVRRSRRSGANWATCPEGFEPGLLQALAILLLIFLI